MNSPSPSWGGGFTLKRVEMPYYHYKEKIIGDKLSLLLLNCSNDVPNETFQANCKYVPWTKSKRLAWEHKSTHNYDQTWDMVIQEGIEQFAVYWIFSRRYGWNYSSKFKQLYFQAYSRKPGFSWKPCFLLKTRGFLWMIATRKVWQLTRSVTVLRVWKVLERCVSWWGDVMVMGEM